MIERVGTELEWSNGVVAGKRGHSWKGLSRKSKRETV